MPTSTIAQTAYYQALQDTISRRVSITLAEGVTDASADRRPPDRQRVDDEVINDFVEANQATYDMWRQKLGETLTLVEVKPHMQSKGERFTGVSDRSMLHAFPENYKLFKHRSQDRRVPRLDYYLYGSVHVKCFRSPNEFMPHLHWLMKGAPLKRGGRPDCQCQYCSAKTQKEVNEIYFPGHDGRKDKDGDGDGRGKRPRRGPKQEPKVQYKDYTKLRPDQVA
ncbi:hypothetical protein B0H21DRAFT_836599 [Amylocystis lapponica]|nr:hypothetical protein B0H21DRAFT_836599 [Amylocystis lapponica]